MRTSAPFYIGIAVFIGMAIGGPLQSWIGVGPITTGAQTSGTTALLSEQRSALGGTTNSVKIESGTVAGNSSQTLLNYTGGQPGYISNFWFAVGSPSGDGAGAIQSASIKITVDGESVPAINVRLPLFFAAEYLSGTAPVYTSRFFTASKQDSNNVAFDFRLPIPFNSSIKIEYVNASAQTAGTGAEITYITGITNNWPHTRKLYTASGTLTNQTVNTVETLVNATGLNRGQLLGVYMSIDSFPNSASPATAPLEGDFNYYFDGHSTADFSTSGTEDWAESGWYFGGFSSGNTSDYAGYTFLSSVTWEFYRLHIPDPMFFNNAIKVTWNCGDSSEVNFTGGVRLAYNVWYYTE